MIHALPARERPHKETRLFGTVDVIRADRARPPGPAAKVHAIPAGCASKVTRASGDVVAGFRKRSNRTGLQAPASRTRFTWARSERRLGNGELFRKANRAAVGMPQAVIGVN